MTELAPRLPMHTSAVFALAYQTWADAVEHDMSWSADRMAQHLIEDPEIEALVVADPLRSQVARLRRREIADDAGFPHDQSRSLLQPRRLRRQDSVRWLPNLLAYTRLDRWLRKHAVPRCAEQPILVSCHPVLAAVADRSAWADVVYYGWDDWLSYPPFRPAHALLSRSYALMAAGDVNVIGVTQAIVDRIGAPRGTVIPNGIAAADYERLGSLPPWFAEISGPIALYAGSLEERVDVAAVEECAQDLPDWTVVLVGHLATPRHFSRLAARLNVVVHGREPRSCRARHDECFRCLPHSSSSDTHVRCDEPAQAVRVSRGRCTGCCHGPPANARGERSMPARRAWLSISPGRPGRRRPSPCLS